MAIKENLDILTLKELLYNSAEKYADNIAVTFIDKQGITYKELLEKVEETSAFLRLNGIQPGDKVAILSENQPNWVISYFAVTTMGAVAVPIMTEFSATEIHHILRHSDSKVIFVSARYLEKIQGARIDDLQTCILMDDFSVVPVDFDRALLKSVINGSRKELSKIKNAALKLAGKDCCEVNEDDLAAILYTSGTTGHSKGVMLSHKNITSNAVVLTGVVDIGVDERLLSILPLYHTFEATCGTLTPMLKGCTIYYLEKPPTPAVLMPALKKIKPTIMISVPLVIEKIFRRKILPGIEKNPLLKRLYKFGALRKKINKKAGAKLLEAFGGKLHLMVIGGAALPEDVEKFMFEAGFPYTVGYGLTETAPVSSGNSPSNIRYRATGNPLEGTEIKIVDPDPETGEGEILIKGPNVMKGYYRDPEKTAEVFTDDGWFRTGDLGFMDEDDFLYIRGRSKNVIIGPNGKNIYPEEIESIINQHKFVVESLVFERASRLLAKVHLNYEEIDGEMDAKKYEEPAIRDKIMSILNEIHGAVNDRVASFSRLHEIVEQLEPFEKTPTLKIKRFLYV